MPDPTPRQGGRPDNLLTSMALAWGQQQADNFIAASVFPVVGVDQKAGKFKEFPRSYFLRDEVGPRPLGGYPRQVGYKTLERDYSVEEEALEALVEDRERANEDPRTPASQRIEAAKIRLLQTQHLIHRDRRWTNAYFKAGVWGEDWTGVASGPTGNQFLQWDNDDSDPVSFVAERILGVGDKVGGIYRPNVLVLGTKAYLRLINHAGLLARLGVNNVRQLNRQLLAQLFEVDRVLVPQGVWNSGPEMATAEATEAAAVYERLVDPEDALLVYAAPNPSTETPSAGYTFAWRGLLGAQADDPTAAVTRGRDDRGYTDWFHVRVAYEFKVVAAELGVFIKDAVAA